MIVASALTSLAIALVLVGIGRPAPRSPSPPRPAAAPPERRSRNTQRRAAIGAIAAITITLTLGPLIACGLTIAVLAGPKVRRLLASRAAQHSIDTTLPDAIEMLVLVVHAGLTPHQAITMLVERAPAPIRPAFAEVRHRTSRGDPLADALHALPDLLGPSAAVVADTLAMAERYGTPIAQALEQLSIDVRERRQRQAEAEARKLPIRMSFPLVVCTLPSFVLIAIIPAVLAALSSLDTTGF
jgi:Flp pilus assembly protein TadB